MKRPKPVLVHGEDEIGTLEITGNDMPWVYGSFAPLPSFEKLSPLFRLLQEALEGNTDPAGEDGEQAKVTSPGIATEFRQPIDRPRVTQFDTRRF